jgi:hypothetical protein
MRKEGLENGKLKKKLRRPQNALSTALGISRPFCYREGGTETAAANPVALKRLENQAVARLLQIHNRKPGKGRPRLPDSHG